MKKLTTGILFTLFLIGYAGAQVPFSFKYQAVVRDALGDIVAQEKVTLKLAVLKNTPEGELLYEETIADSTNNYGLISVNVGTGQHTGGLYSSLDTIAWGASKHFLRVGLKLSGAENFRYMGTSQLLSVPYALYSQKAGNVFSGNYYELSNRPNLSSYVKKVETATWDKDTLNELQTLALEGYTLSISKKGYTVELPDSVHFATYADNPGDEFVVSYSRVLDKPQLSIRNDTIFLTDAGYVDLPDTIDYAINPTFDFELPYSQIIENPNEDFDTTNEYQVLTRREDTLLLENGGFVVLSDSIEYAEIADSVPELQQQVDSLEALLTNKADQNTVDSLEKRLNAQANTNWLSKTEGFYIDQRDKHRYDFKLIGNQVWMTENLNSGIMLNSPEQATANDTIEKYAYNDLSPNLDTTAGLYTWREMMQLPDSCQNSDCAQLIQDQHQGVCPDGWHIPDTAEWQILIEAYGGNSEASDELKSTGSLWETPLVANNSSGFTALPGGEKQAGNTFVDKGTKAYFGVSNQNDKVSTYIIVLRNDNTVVYRPIESKEHAVSVRCIQDL